jgi:putative phage-type endonuclease
MSLTEQQKADRMLGLGGSDIGAVVGLNPYSSAHSIYNEKRGLVEPFAGNAATDWGNLMEPVLLDWYSEHHLDGELHRNHGMVHAENDWMRGNLDGLVFKDGRPHKVIEAKTAHWRLADQWGDEGSDQVPDSYLVQCAWYMAIADVNLCDLVVAIDREIKVFHITRDLDLERKLIAKGKDFWENHVLPGIPPAIDGSDGCTERLALHKADEGEVEATDEMTARAIELYFVSQQIKKLEGEKSVLKNQLADLLGDQGKKIKSPQWGSAYWTAPKPKPSTNWEAAAKEVGIPDEVLAKHTREVSRKPSFQARFKKEIQTS